LSVISNTPKPPYYAVIFTSERTPGDKGYEKMGDMMVNLAAKQPGFLGIESARDQHGLGITVSYWESLDAIRNWKDNAQHKVAQAKGKEMWYKNFGLRVCLVERDQFF
jgi:heme-degrading monooxygenase HmoA